MVGAALVGMTLVGATVGVETGVDVEIGVGDGVGTELDTGVDPDVGVGVDGDVCSGDTTGARGVVVLRTGGCRICGSTWGRS